MPIVLLPLRSDAKIIDCHEVYRLHWIKNMSLKSIAERLDIDSPGLLRRVRRHGMNIRGHRDSMVLLGETKKGIPLGDKSYNWKGGYTVTKRGYIINNRTKKYLHREIAEKVLGRELKRYEDVHHINGNKGDNRNCNLLICTRSFHLWLHAKMNNFRIGKHLNI